MGNFPTEKPMSFEQFCNRLRDDGAYIGEDGHVYRKDGRQLSTQCRNGYYMVKKMYDNCPYSFMEHRVVWYFCNGSIDRDKVINHKDFDRTNNHIGNLELITQQENTRYSLDNGRFHFRKGCDSPRAFLNEKEVQAIRYMAKNGWKQRTLAKLFGAKNPNLISRVVTGARYGTVLNAESILAIYPVIVKKTCNNPSYREGLSNIGLGLTGEAGEVADIIKKHLHQGHDLDPNALIEEMGDVLYYLCWLCLQLDIDISELCFANMKKLNERYPDGFDPERSIHRKEYENGVH